MQDPAETRIKQDILFETQKLHQNYGTIARFLSGTDYDITELSSTLKEFKDSLSRASAFILALYNLRGQRVNIPWDSLFTSLELCFGNNSSFSTFQAKISHKNDFINVSGTNGASNDLLFES